MKKLISIFLSMLIALSNSYYVFAENNTKAVGCNVSTYVSVNSKKTKTAWGTTVTAINKTSTKQSLTKSISRTKYSSFGVSTTAEIQMLTSSVGVTAEVSTNTSKTSTISYTVNVPANSTVYMHYGTKRVYGSASKKRRESDCSITTLKTFNYDYGYEPIVEWWQ